MAIGKKGDHTLLEKGRQQIFNLKIVYMLRCFVVTVGVIESKIMCLYELRDTINFYLWLVNKNLWIPAAHCVNFPRLSFFAKEGSLTDADADLHCG